MKPRASSIKPIVAALALAVGFSLPARADDARMADLLDQLRSAENDRAADLILREIRAEWSRSGSPAIDLLLQRGTDALEAGDLAAAVEHLTAAIDHAPAFAEAYHQRATALYLLGEVGPAVADLQQVLALNPGHFAAMQGFAVILEEMGRTEDALETWRQVLAINPQDDAVSGAVGRLELELAGRAL
jgi:tetratricopeptide (TPR) repeat protein